MKNMHPSVRSLPNSLKIYLPERVPVNKRKNTILTPNPDVIDVCKDASLSLASSSSIPTSLAQDASATIAPPSLALIQRYGANGVCRATYQSIHLVIKFAFGRDTPRIKALEKEAKNYDNSLFAAQGTIVPCMYGIYKGTTCDERRLPVACLILEDCGDCLTEEFRDLPLEERVKMMKVYCDLHMMGIALLGFTERNVVHKNGNYRLIGFENLDDRHSCKWKGKLYEGKPPPENSKIGCSFILVAGSEMGLWTLGEGRVRVVNDSMSADEFPPQEDIDFLCNNAEFSLSPAKMDELHDWLKAYKKVRDQIPLEDYARSRPDFSYA
ncbi:hypothetical protein SCHPADRAFT_997479 [Schizopora paradoxa]|uniref:Uncharacterized protein n=1 Tax=Schizopora paradoxa TaxID=27342 RepID=A0A0H2RUX4_9AGAM|nr:hypothetical protein SCHPADRAFT_997479 [Schizopora paradoxa]